MNEYDPQTLDEWQEAVDAAHVLLLIESARAYGLVTGGPEINSARCQQILNGGRGYGVLPAEVNVKRLMREYLR